MLWAYIKQKHLPPSPENKINSGVKESTQESSFTHLYFSTVSKTFLCSVRNSSNSIQSGCILKACGCLKTTICVWNGQQLKSWEKADSHVKISPSINTTSDYHTLLNKVGTWSLRPDCVDVIVLQQWQRVAHLHLLQMRWSRIWGCWWRSCGTVPAQTWFSLPAKDMRQK